MNPTWVTHKAFKQILRDHGYNSEVKQECNRVWGTRKKALPGTVQNILKQVLTRISFRNSKRTQPAPFGPTTGFRVKLKGPWKSLK